MRSASLGESLYASRKAYQVAPGNWTFSFPACQLGLLPRWRRCSPGPPRATSSAAPAAPNCPSAGTTASRPSHLGNRIILPYPADTRAQTRFVARIEPARDRPLRPARATFSTHLSLYHSAGYGTFKGFESGCVDSLRLRTTPPRHYLR